MNEALISGIDCGALPLDDSTPESTGEIMSYQYQKSVDFFTYGAQCYPNNGSSSLDACGTFVASMLPYTTDTNAPCPFEEEMCKSPTGNILLDSGELDSYKHLGFNAGPRFTLRHSTHCAPLNSQNFTSIRTDTEDPSKRFIRYNYGSSFDRDYLYEVQLATENITMDGFSMGNYVVM
jgi:hypothetical protein